MSFCACRSSSSPHCSAFFSLAKSRAASSARCERTIVSAVVAAGCRFRQGEQLQLEALGAVARAHAGGVEILQMLERDLQLLGLDLQLSGNDLHELLQRLREVPVLVERFDQEGHQIPVARFELGERELPVQVLPEVGRLGGDLRDSRRSSSESSRVPEPEPPSPTQSSSAEKLSALRRALRLGMLRWRLGRRDRLSVHVRAGPRGAARPRPRARAADFPPGISPAPGSVPGSRAAAGVSTAAAAASASGAATA